MFRPLKAILLGSGLAVAASAALASPALATTSQPAAHTCGDGVAVWTHDTHAPAACVTGAGRHETHVTEAYQITAGSHGGVAYIKCGCVWVKKVFHAGDTIVLDKGSTVTQIDIS
jgi:hypothetical protein